ncbi:MAG TPA: GNAT family N-acetyltransferase [Oscillospiraceae bacterium]|nr:GNAT family N-acetyltransferase [Oscillospiraceae bacterium]HRW57381.1 GNAT family N-acetyltransferase [Oscillospiraceae bacterium]
MEFLHDEDSIYMTDKSGNRIAEVTFPISDGVANIIHTYVDPSLRGQGVASQMMTAAVEQIRSAGLKARPTCSYAVKWFAEHPEYLYLL